MPNIGGVDKQHLDIGSAGLFINHNHQLSVDGPLCWQGQHFNIWLTNRPEIWIDHGAKRFNYLPLKVTRYWIGNKYCLTIESVSTFIIKNTKIILKCKIMRCQQRAFLHWKFLEKVALIGWNLLFILVLESGRTVRKPYC